MKKKPRYRTSQRNPREKPAVAKRCCVRCRYELFRRFESATKPLFSSLALRSGVTRRCVSMTTSVSLDRVSCPEGFLSDRETLKERVREREREREGGGRKRKRARVEIDRSVCQQTERQPIRREDLTCNRLNRRRLFERNSAVRQLTLPLSVFYFSRCPIAAMTTAERIRACTQQPAGSNLQLVMVFPCAIQRILDTPC